MERKDYWNQTYVDYYKGRVEESNTAKQGASKLIAEDVKVADDHVAEAFFNQVTYTPGMKLLDIGCGWGRFSSFFVKRGWTTMGSIYPSR
jgi:Cyclopropane-fatty-acyl-phospholipid synthase.